jgi:flagellar biosynthetic protein FlhB
VAQVLAWVYQLRNAMAGKGQSPAPLGDVPVPPELDPHLRDVARAAGGAA